MPLLNDINIGAAGDEDKKLESIVQQTNEAFRKISNEERTKITKDDAQTQRLLIGYQENGFNNGNVGIKLSQEGVDVANASDDQLIFSSDFNMFKIVGTGTVTMTVPAVSQLNTVTITHNLGYVPAVVSFIKNPDGTYRQMPFTYWVRSTGITLAVAWADASTTTVNFNLDNDSIALVGDYTFRYYLLQETAS